MKSSTMQGCVSSRVETDEASRLVHGYVAPGFEVLRDVFETNFRRHGELGAAFALYFRGEIVADLWGGYSRYDEHRKWTRETLAPVFSTTKGLASMTLAIAHSRGWLDYDEKVSTYWPEFAQRGKASITVRQLLAHEAGLVRLRDRLSISDLADLKSVATLLARQSPQWEPGTAHGYHSSTLGLYMNALLTRVDPHRRSLGTFFADEIAAPLGLHFYIGLPPSIPNSSVAHIVVARPAAALLHIAEMPLPTLSRMICPWSYLAHSFAIPRGFDINARATWSVEIPSGNGIGDARSIAHAYGEIATGGRKLGLTENTLRELSAPAIASHDKVLGIASCYSLGFSRPHAGARFGSASAFGAAGAGGSFGFADPEHQLGYAYLMTRMGYHVADDPRELSLRHATYECIERIENDEGEPCNIEAAVPCDDGDGD